MATNIVDRERREYNDDVDAYVDGLRNVLARNR